MIRHTSKAVPIAILKRQMISLNWGEDHQDHQDHLPSMAHLIIPKEINYQMPLAFEVRERPQFFLAQCLSSP